MIVSQANKTTNNQQNETFCSKHKKLILAALIISSIGLGLLCFVPGGTLVAATPLAKIAAIAGPTVAVALLSLIRKICATIAERHRRGNEENPGQPSHAASLIPNPTPEIRLNSTPGSNGPAPLSSVSDQDAATDSQLNHASASASAPSPVSNGSASLSSASDRNAVTDGQPDHASASASAPSPVSSALVDPQVEESEELSQFRMAIIEKALTLRNGLNYILDSLPYLVNSVNRVNDFPLYLNIDKLPEDIADIMKKKQTLLNSNGAKTIDDKMNMCCWDFVFFTLIESGAIEKKAIQKIHDRLISELAPHTSEPAFLGEMANLWRPPTLLRKMVKVSPITEQDMPKPGDLIIRRGTDDKTGRSIDVHMGIYAGNHQMVSMGGTGDSSHGMNRERVTNHDEFISLPHFIQQMKEIQSEPTSHCFIDREQEPQVWRAYTTKVDDQDYHRTLANVWETMNDPDTDRNIVQRIFVKLRPPTPYSLETEYAKVRAAYKIAPAAPAAALD